MENKNRILCPLKAHLLIILSLFASILGAQEYYLDKSDEETRFVQRLVWQAEEFALRYEVVIEKDISIPMEPARLPETALPGEAALPEETALPGEAALPEETALLEESLTDSSGEETELHSEADNEEAVFSGILREFTDAAYIEVSLPPGNYRFKVIAYDLLDRAGEESEWAHFEIILALEPELHTFSPVLFQLDKDTGPWIINITGLNLSPDAEVYLHHTTKKNLNIVPREFSAASDLSSATMVFDIRQLTPGSYEICIKNPGGLDASAGTFEIGFEESFDMYLGVSYSPLVPIYGGLDELENRSIFPLGAALRFGLIPLKKAWGHLGVELTASWNYLSSGSGSDKVSFHILGAEAAALYQRWLPNRTMAVTVRAGAGLAGTTGMLLPQAGAGAGFLWIFRKPFFVEAGIDYIHRFADDSSPGYLRPWLGVGVKL